MKEVGWRLLNEKSDTKKKKNWGHEIKGTSNYCLCFSNTNVVLKGYTDVNMVEYVDTRKSTTHYLYTFVGATISWMYRFFKSSDPLHNRGRIHRYHISL